MSMRFLDTPDQIGASAACLVLARRRMKYGEASGRDIELVRCYRALLERGGDGVWPDLERRVGQFESDDQAVCSTCRRCGRELLDIGLQTPRWVHPCVDGALTVGCRAATFEPRTLWDEDVPAWWKAAPVTAQSFYGGAVQRPEFVEIRRILGLAPPQESPGSTVLSGDVQEVAARLGVPWAGSIQRSWNAIIAALGDIPEASDLGGGGDGTGTITAQGFQKVLDALGELAERGHLDLGVESIPVAIPEDEAAGRTRVLRQVTQRQGQPAFRRALRVAYSDRCCVTGAGDVAVLEAAHIRQYDGAATNRVSNGLLLRSDIHTLFDLHLLSVATDLTVLVSSTLSDPIYRGLHGAFVEVPNAMADRPDPEALAFHRASFIP